jgi:two-component sensor histidine kinase/PAS domain-containing protein
MNSLASTRRILVVEDEVMVSWALEDILVDLGYFVIGPAARVEQALGLIENGSIDAAVLDINLDGEKGYRVADALTARGVPFVFLTGYNKQSIHPHYQIHGTLQKPLERSTLDEALTKLLVPGTTVTLGKRHEAAIWDAHRLRIASDAAGVALWSWNVDTDQISMDERAHELWGVPSGAVTFTDLSARIHPEDLDRVRAAFSATREIVGAYEVDFRILHGTDVRWISGRGRGDDQGIVGRMMFGVFLDVTERKIAEEAREMIAGEMGHRVKNLFAMALALAGISARTTTTTSEMARDFTLRLNALSRAHDLVRPVLSDPKKAALLGDLLAVLLEPYTNDGPLSANVKVSVPELMVGEASATTLALVVHELATNSIKYGALSKATGTLDVSCRADDSNLVIVWREQGGPPVVAPTGPRGFGSQLIEKSMKGQLGGTIEFEWCTGGVVVTLRVNKARLGG